MPPTPSFCEKQNTDGIVPLHAQNVKNETFTKIKSRKTQAFVEQAEIFTNRYFFLAARGQLCYTKPVPTAGGVRLRRAVFLRLSMYRGLVLPRLSHQSANQQSVCVLEKRKQAQRIRGKFQGAPEFATFASPQALRARCN